jgi:hypothetical protein
MFCKTIKEKYSPSVVSIMGRTYGFYYIDGIEKSRRSPASITNLDDARVEFNKWLIERYKQDELIMSIFADAKMKSGTMVWGT